MHAHNKQVTAPASIPGGAECPQRLMTGEFLLTYGERRGDLERKKGKRGENREEKKENCKKKKGGKLKMEVRKVTK